MNTNYTINTRRSVLPTDVFSKILLHFHMNKYMYVKMLMMILFFSFLYYSVDRYYNYEAFTKKMEGGYDYIYFTTTTASTVGYGDISPKTFGAKMVVILQFILVMGSFFSFIIPNLK